LRRGSVSSSCSNIALRVEFVGVVLRIEHQEIRDQALHGEMLLDGLVEDLLRLFCHHRRIEDLLFDRGVGGELVGELLKQGFLVTVAVLDRFEQLVDFLVLLGKKLEHIDRVGLHATEILQREGHYIAAHRVQRMCV
jgi:hypothetical protein